MTDEEIAQVLARDNSLYRSLSEEHKILKQRLNDYNTRHHLTPEEEAERKNIQKIKLAKKDQMADMVRKFRQTQA